MTDWQNNNLQGANQPEFNPQTRNALELNPQELNPQELNGQHPSPQPSPTSLKIAVVGDVHHAWDEADEPALRHLGVDLVLLVGDFGNESVEVVRSIATLSIPKAVILGNHDAWYSASPWGIKQCPYDRTQEDRVQQQLELLGDTHVGYGKLDFPTLGLSVVGSRPFSWGGSEWKNGEFFHSRYGVNSFAASTDRIVQAAAQTASNTVIFLGHCGPLGLGDQPEDPCGRDWNPIGGDHGDPDFAEAIVQTRQLGKTIPLVAFGHMHHHLRHTKFRLRTPIATDAAGTIYVNAANVPRIVNTGNDRRRNFSLVSLQNGSVTQVSLVWLNQTFSVVSEDILYQSSEQGNQPGRSQEAAVR